jgi:acyl-CoA reductase-like NAD-dependent aldehyde dehydrogenase
MDTIPALIDGDDVTTDSVFEVRSPYDEGLLGVVAQCGAREIDHAVSVAQRRLATPLPAFERAAVLDRAAILLTERHEEFAQLISGESAKPISAARIESRRAVDTLRLSAAQARTLTGEMVAMDATESGAGRFGYVLRVPIGVIAAVSPFNFPLNLVCHKIAPAVAAGCPVVLKPASATPMTALAIARLFEEAGLPAGWLNVVPCPGSVADHLVTHPHIAMVTFTGSPEVGWGIRARAPQKRVSLELGNNAPVIVCADADLALAATKIVAGGYGFSGQTCISVQRVYADRSIRAELEGLVANAAAALPVGSPAEPDVSVSALITRGETERVHRWIHDAVDGGANLLTGGEHSDDGVLMPTVLSSVTDEMQVFRDEVFGPVVGIAEFETIQEAYKRANDSRYGLQAAVFTHDINTAIDAGYALDFGGVVINDMPTYRADQQPYGGVRDSGNTREGPAYTVLEMTERRMVTIAR